MRQEFNDAKKAYVNRDDKGIARDILQSEDSFVSHAPTAQLAAAEYISKYGDLLGIKSEETQSLGLTAEKDMIDAGGELRFYSEKRLFDIFFSIFLVLVFSPFIILLFIWIFFEQLFVKNRIKGHICNSIPQTLQKC